MDRIVNFLVDRELLAEILSTFMLVLLGDGSVAQWMLLNVQGTEPFLLVNMAYGCGVTFGVYLAGGVSGAHMNPAVSVALATFKKFPWRKVPKYILGQMIGAFLGAMIVFLTYFTRIAPSHLSGTLTKEAAAGIFGTYPSSDTNAGIQFLDQVVGTAILLMVISALGDKKNTPPPEGVAPILIGLSVFAIGAAFGTNCGYPINPARDLAPRIFSLIAGYGTYTFTAAKSYFWVPIIGPIVGGVFGVALYGLMIECRHPREEPAQLQNATFADLVTSDCEGSGP